MATVGITVEWRRRGLSRTLEWTLPLSFTAVASLTVFTGTVAYFLYTSSLGLPHDALDFNTFEKAAAGALPVAIGIGVAYVWLGLSSLWRWFSGSTGGGGGLSGIPIMLVSIFYWLLALYFDVKDPVLGAYRAESSEILSYYTIQPEYACVSKIGDDVAVEGGGLDQSKPWVIVGEGGERYLLYRQGEYRRIAISKLSTSPVASLSADCPTDSG